MLIDEKGIRARAHLQNVKELLLYNTPICEVDTRSYGERLSQALKQLEQLVETACPEQKEAIMEEALHCLTVAEDVYFELGMKAGANLELQLLSLDGK